MTTEFSELYEQFAGRVLAYARRHANRDDAEDVVAETFHVAWRRRDVVPDEPLPWLNLRVTIRVPEQDQQVAAVYGPDWATYVFVDPEFTLVL